MFVDHSQCPSRKSFETLERISIKLSKHMQNVQCMLLKVANGYIIDKEVAVREYLCGKGRRRGWTWAVGRDSPRQQVWRLGAHGWGHLSLVHLFHRPMPRKLKRFWEWWTTNWTNSSRNQPRTNVASSTYSSFPGVTSPNIFWRTTAWDWWLMWSCLICSRKSTSPFTCSARLTRMSLRWSPLIGWIPTTGSSLVPRKKLTSEPASVHNCSQTPIHQLINLLIKCQNLNEKTWSTKENLIW